VRLQDQEYILVAKDGDQDTMFDRKTKGATKDYNSRHEPTKPETKQEKSGHQHQGSDPNKTLRDENRASTEKSHQAGILPTDNTKFAYKRQAP
jgi:hypothetical protein